MRKFITASTLAAGAMTLVSGAAVAGQRVTVVNPAGLAATAPEGQLMSSNSSNSSTNRSR
jgi:hypothetical protein